MVQAKHILFLCAISLFACACGGIDQRPLQAEELGWFNLALPDMPHVVSDTAVINGTDHDAYGGQVIDEPPVATIDAQEENASWALYSFGLTDCSLSSITVAVASVESEYWVGLANYEDNRWDWRGPFTDDTEVAPWGDPDNYLSPTENVHWVVVASRGHSFFLISSTVAYSQDIIFHVPPTGLQTITTDPALYPSLILMSEGTPRAEPGAPVIFFLGGEGANTYYAYYDGEAWQQKLALPEGPVITHPVARGFPAYGGGTEALLAAYDVADDKPYLYRFNNVMAHDGWPIHPKSTGAGALSMLAMDCLDAGIWVLAEVRTTGDDAQITAVYDDLTDSIKPVYQETLIAEDVAGIDVIYYGSKPTIAYSHGVVDDSDAILLDFAVTVANPGGSTWWDTFPADYDHSPLSLDLGLDRDGNLQMLFIAGRNFDFVFPDPPIPPLYEIHATLYYDVVAGTYNGTSWDYAEMFTSEAAIEILENTLSPNWGINASWAGADALSYSHVDGIIEFTLSPSFEITGGELFNHVQLMERPSGSFVEGPEYSATPGVAFSWAEGPSGLSCAYIRAEQVDITEILGGQVAASSDLLYWSSWQ